MKIDFSQELHTIRGAPLKERIIDGDGNENLETVTLGSCAVGALLNPESGAQGKEKAKRYSLAIRIQSREDEELDVSVADGALIQKLIGKCFNPLMVGQCWEMLEAAANPKPEKAEKKEKKEKKDEAPAKAKEPAPAEA